MDLAPGWEVGRFNRPAADQMHPEQPVETDRAAFMRQPATEATKRSDRDDRIDILDLGRARPSAEASVPYPSGQYGHRTPPSPVAIRS